MCSECFLCPRLHSNGTQELVASLTPDTAQLLVLRVLAALCAVAATAAAAAPRLLRLCAGALVYDKDHTDSLVSK